MVMAIMDEFWFHPDYPGVTLSFGENEYGRFVRLVLRRKNVQIVAFEGSDKLTVKVGDNFGKMAHLPREEAMDFIRSNL